jgi:hypothetical protein
VHSLAGDKRRIVNEALARLLEPPAVEGNEDGLMLLPSKIASRRFPAPWHIAELPGGWAVEDATGSRVAYVYGDDRPKAANDQTMTKDEARRIAANIARLPELLQGRKKA